MTVDKYSVTDCKLSQTSAGSS